jgi:hypothetical protein
MRTRKMIKDAFKNASFYTGKDKVVAICSSMFADRVQNVDYVHTGGGCTDVLMHLKDFRVVCYHHTGDFIMSADKWLDIDEYMGESANEREVGFGYEDNSPEIELRNFNTEVVVSSDEILTRIADVMQYKYQCDHPTTGDDVVIRDHHRNTESEAKIVGHNDGMYYLSDGTFIIIEDTDAYANGSISWVHVGEVSVRLKGTDYYPPKNNDSTKYEKGEVTKSEYLSNYIELLNKGFEYKGVQIKEPMYNESMTTIVKPLEYYGDAYEVYLDELSVILVQELNRAHSTENRDEISLDEYAREYEHTMFEAELISNLLAKFKK